MARLLAVEWDAAEARVAVGRARGASVVVEQAFSIPLPKRAAGEGAASEKEIGAAIAAALTQRGLARSEALVAVGRANIELRFLTTPPTPAEELPDLVRFQAMRQFTTLGDDWPLDFVPLEENRDGGINVLAAAISPDLVRQIRDTCSAAGISCSRLVLRPFATASLLLGEKTDDRCRMLVDLLRDEADLTVMAGGKVIFPRTIRLPESDSGEVQGRALLAEIRRTVIAAQNQLGGRKVEQVVIFGDSRHHAALKKLLEEELTLEAGVELYDPFTKVELDGEAQRARPEFPGTFAPLLGMLAEEAAGRPQQIDFLHPRQRPKPQDRRRLYALAGGAVGAVALAAVLLLWLQLSAQSSAALRLQQEINRQEKLVKAGKSARDKAAKLERFEKGDISWLDELRVLSLHAPPPEKTRVEDLHAIVHKDGGGLMTIDALSSDSSLPHDIGQSLRKSGRVVQTPGAAKDPKLTGQHTWKHSVKIGAIPIVDRVATSKAEASSQTPRPAKRKSGSAIPGATRKTPPAQGGKS